MLEWLIRPVSKTGVVERLPWVQIPPSPPFDSPGGARKAGEPGDQGFRSRPRGRPFRSQRFRNHPASEPTRSAIPPSASRPCWFRSQSEDGIPTELEKARRFSRLRTSSESLSLSLRANPVPAPLLEKGDDRGELSLVEPEPVVAAGVEDDSRTAAVVRPVHQLRAGRTGAVLHGRERAARPLAGRAGAACAAGAASAGGSARRTFARVSASFVTASNASRLRKRPEQRGHSAYPTAPKAWATRSSRQSGQRPDPSATKAGAGRSAPHFTQRSASRGERAKQVTQRFVARSEPQWTQARASLRRGAAAGGAAKGRGFRGRERPRGQRVGCLLRSRKNSFRILPHSSPRTPASTWTLWLRRSSRQRSPSEPTNPAFGSAAP